MKTTTTAIAILLACVLPASAATQLMVDWGDSAANNVLPFYDWNTVFLGNYTSYTSDGPAGIHGGWTGSQHTMGIHGSVPVVFHEDDQIIVTWYNTGSSSFTFTPQISFDDPDSPTVGASGTWYAMSSLTIPAGESATSSYSFSAATAGTYTRVHVSRFTNNGSDVICDKFELQPISSGPTLYPLTVNNGTGSGDYEAGATVIIAADQAAAGYVFDAWAGDNATLASTTDAQTTLTMPAQPATVTATYRLLNALGTPAISSAAALTTWTNNSTVTITGANFGTKIQAAPRLWDTVDNQPNYASLSENDVIPTTASDPWSENTNIYADDKVRLALSGNRGYRTAHYKGTGNKAFLTWPRALGGSHAPADQIQLYVTWWYKPSQSPDSEGGSNKFIRVWDDGNGYGTRISWTQDQLTYSGDGPAGYHSWTQEGNTGQWNRMEFWVSADEHKIRTWINTIACVYFNSAAGGDFDVDEFTKVDNGLGLNVALVGFDHGMTAYDNMLTEFGEVYVDVTRARVEIGDAPTWSACSHREIQIPSQWAEGSITISLNPGTLGSPVGKYLYVVNDAGKYNEQGYLITDQLPASVRNRFILYNASAFDNDNLAPNSDDDLAIATDKSPLLPGETATFANYSSYSRGLNALIIDIDNLAAPELLSSDDFAFTLGNSNDPTSWLPAPTPLVSVRSGAGPDSSDRVTILFPDDSITSTWLQVTVKATSHTGLPADDTFYFGSAPGDSGNSASNTFVNAFDAARVRDNAAASVSIANPLDFNRDAAVDALDLDFARSHSTNYLNALKLITPAAP